jgi:hypothetical protein
MSIESKIPRGEEINIADLNIEQPETNSTFSEQLYKLADEQFFSEATFQIYEDLSKKISLKDGLSKAANMKICFPEWNIDLGSYMEKIKAEVLHRRKHFNQSKVLEFLATLKILFPNMPEIWTPSDAEEKLFQSQISTKVRDATDDYKMHFTSLGTWAAAYKILYPNSSFIAEIFSDKWVKKAVNSGIDWQVGDWGFEQSLDNIYIFKFVCPEILDQYLRAHTKDSKRMEGNIKQGVTESAAQLPRAIILFSDLDFGNDRVAVKDADKLMHPIEKTSSLPFPEIKRF